MAPRDNAGSPGNPQGSGQPKSGRAGWRSTAARPQVREASSQARGWWQTRPKQSKQHIGMRARLALGILVLVVLFGTYVYLVSRQPIKVPLFAFAVVDYGPDSHLPPNGWALEDLKRFEALHDNGANVEATALGTWGSHGDSRAAAIKTLHDTFASSKFNPGGPKKDVILVYLSAHGVVNNEGDPCLLLADSKPSDPDSWLPLKDVFDELKKFSEKDGVKKKGVKTVVALDCNRIRFNWSWGILYNTFADAVEELASSDAYRSDLFVINSTGKGEVGVAGPEIAGSVFGYYFYQALNGGAAQGGQVSLGELAGYLNSRADLWVYKHRNSQQRPWLIGEHKDFPLAYAGSTPASEVNEEKQLNEWIKTTKGAWKNVDDLWKSHEQLQDPKGQKAYRYSPLKWAEFERGLLRLEQLLLAGTKYETEFRDLKTKLDITKDQLGKQDDLPIFSLAAMPRPSSPAQGIANGLVASPSVGPLPSEPIAPDREYLTRASGQWNNLLQGRPANDDILKIADWPTRPGVPDVIEVHFARMLARYVDQPAKAADLLLLAVRSREAAERAAMPADERVHYWITSGVGNADSFRRRAEDLLFVGSTASNDEERQEWEKARQEYANSQKRAAQRASSFELRDRGWVEAPYLAQWLWERWLTSRENQAGSKGTADPNDTDPNDQRQWLTLMSGIEGLHELSASLEELPESPGKDDQAEATLAKARQDMNALDKVKGLTALVEEFRGKMLDQTKNAPDATTLARIERGLATPLLSSEVRQTLRDRYVDILKNPHNTADGGSSQPTRDRSARLNFADWPARHPLMELLNSDSDDKSDQNKTPDEPKLSRAKDVAPREAKARKLIAAVDKQCEDCRTSANAQLVAMIDRLKGNSTPRAESDAFFVKIHNQRSRADRLVRAAAAFMKELAVDPTQELRRLDLHRFLVWQSERTLEDFWGSGETDAPPYFQTVADKYLDAADDQIGTAYKGLCDPYRRRVDAARELVQATVRKKVTVSKGQITVPVQLLIDSADLPPGIAAVYLREKESETQKPLVPLFVDQQSDSAVEIRRAPYDVALKSPKTLSGAIRPGSWAKDANDLLQSVALYRGHVKVHPVHVSPPGVPIEYHPKPQPPTIAVRGDQKEPISVMFIFDCSRSMEGTDIPSDKGVETRIAAARRTLIEFLRGLSEKSAGEQFRVGLEVYGHRLTYATERVAGREKYALDPKNQNNYVKAWSGFEKRDPVAAKPSYPGTDVQLLQKISRFGRPQFDEIKKNLDDLQPWGMTPLYFSIKSAMEAFAPADTVKRIVVLTDGEDQSGPVDGHPTVTHDQLLKLLSVHPNIQLDVIGFGPEFTAASEAAKLTQGRGKFFKANNAADLLDRLKESLHPGKFEVARVGGVQERSSDKLDLNKPWPLPLPKERTKYEVTVTGVGPSATPKEEVWLEGNEALELFLERGQGQGQGKLVFHRYLETETCFRTVANARPGTASARFPAAFWIAAHVPTLNLQKKEATFQISIQNNDSTRFSPRPAEVWIEIRPVMVDDIPTGQPYCFCDLDFVPGQTVPVLECVAREFPTNAKKAEVKLWFKMERTPADDIRSVEELTKGYTITSAQKRLAAEIEKIDSQEVAVAIEVTSLDEAKEETEPLKIDMEWDKADAPSRVERDYTRGRHVFYFPAGKADQVSGFKVRITSLKSLQEGATKCTLEPKMRSR